MKKKKPTKINSLQDLGKAISFRPIDDEMKKRMFNDLFLFGTVVTETNIDGTRIIPREEIYNIIEDHEKSI